MPYAQVLNGLIEKSGLSAVEIAKRCGELGQDVSPSYISLLRNEKNNRVASEDISRALSVALNADPDLLVLESYLDNAPETIREFVSGVKNMMRDNTVSAIKQIAKTAKTVAIKKQFDGVPMSDFVLYFCKEIKKNNVNFERMKGKAAVDISFPVADDAMSPVLKEGDRVQIDYTDVCKSGDIVAYSLKDKDELRYRKLLISGDSYTMLPFNATFPIETYSKDDIVILGRVAEVGRKI
ncbi:MAG: S24 family peptidase [Oscillospiraceae bacterium]|nr:S24 family peptidase [Oscillospiraceae bacterium]